MLIMKPTHIPLPEKAKPSIVVIVPSNQGIVVRDEQGHTLYNSHPESPAPILCVETDRALVTVIIKDSIIELMAIVHGKDKLLFTQVNYWQMIYRILVDRGLMPSGYQDFHDCMVQMGNDFRIPCSYEALKDIDDVFAKPFKQWKVSLYHGKRVSTYNHKYEIARVFDEIVERRMNLAA